jgi:hypothetical protein
VLSPNVNLAGEGKFNMSVYDELWCSVCVCVCVCVCCVFEVESEI